MSEPTYTPDDNDKDWLKGIGHGLLDPNDPTYEARLKWRREHGQSQQSHGWRDFIIGVIMMIVIVFIAIALAGNSWSPETGNAPSSGVSGCEASGNC